MNKPRRKKKDAFKIIYFIIGLEMLAAVGVIAYFAVRYGGILAAGLQKSSNTNSVVDDPGYPIDVNAALNDQGDAQAADTEEDTTEAPFVPSSVELVAVGDNLMHRSCTLSGRQADGSYDYTEHFSNLKAIFQESDLAILSQDTVMGGIELGTTSTETGIFNTALEVGKGMAEAGINVVLAANNHILDEGRSGLNTMMSYFSTNYPEISLLGVNSSREAKDTPVYVTKNGITFALVNYSYGSNQTTDLDSSPYLLNVYDEEWLADILEQAQQKADFIIAFPFWGEQNSLDYNEEQEKQAQFLADHGVDLIIGSYPHVVEPVRWITAENGDETLVYYSMGNFQSIQNTAENMLGGLAKVTVSKDEAGTYISDYSLDFVVTHYEQVSTTEYYDVVTTYLLSDYTDELAARHGMTVSGSEDFNLASLQGLKNQILSKCDLERE